MIDYQSAESLESWALIVNMLADDALNMAGEYHAWEDQTLVDATLIFMEVFMAKMYEFHKDKLSQEQMEALATEAGTSIRQTIELFTGKDMPELVKQQIEK